MNPGNNFPTNGNTGNNIQRRILVTPQQFMQNERLIQQQAAQLSEMNRRGLGAYMEMHAADLQQRVAEGEQARWAIVLETQNID